MQGQGGMPNVQFVQQPVMYGMNPQMGQYGQATLIPQGMQPQYAQYYAPAGQFAQFMGSNVLPGNFVPGQFS